MPALDLGPRISLLKLLTFAWLRFAGKPEGDAEMRRGVMAGEVVTAQVGMEVNEIWCPYQQRSGRCLLEA